MYLTRTIFDAACDSIDDLPDAALTRTQRETLWNFLLPNNARGRSVRPCWTQAATELRAPLLRDINTVYVQQLRCIYHGKWLTAAGKPPVEMAQMHNVYASRLNDIRMRMDSALKAHGHWCLPSLVDAAQPLSIIVRNEIAADRWAGTKSWVQWEEKRFRDPLRNIFTQYAATLKPARVTQWLPYTEHEERKRGAAAVRKQMREWNSAFHDELTNRPLYSDISEHMRTFNATLRSSPVQQAIEEAIRVQCALHRGPKNQAFTGSGRSIWHVLPVDMRVNLAHEYHAALTATCAELRANDRAVAAEMYRTDYAFNCFSLTKEERATLGLA